MSVKKIINKRVSRAVGRRFNLFGEEDAGNVSELQDIVEKIAEKVDTGSGRVEKPASSGLVGSIRSVKSKNEWFVEIKTDEGWIRSSSGSFALKDKNS